MKLHNNFGIRFWVSLLLINLVTGLRAQEMNAEVQVLSPGIQTTNRQIFTTLGTTLQQLINATRWTNLEYQTNERITCSFVLNITSINGNTFQGTLQVQYSRPIYKTGYNSSVLNYMDNDVTFNYTEFLPLEFVEGRSTNNLTNIVAYYVYVILGMDHDTFERNAGREFYRKAQDIVNLAQGDGNPGWKSFDGNRNRFWLVDNLLNNTFSPIIDCLYQYHRQGLDLMHEPTRQADAKKNILNALMGMGVVHQKRPNSMLMGVFFDAKGDEIVNIFSGGEPMNVAPLKDLLQKMDPVRGNRYQNLGAR
jgi:hypothetical protein